MATKLTKLPLLRALQARGYSTPAPVSGTSNYDVKTTVLSNKLVVASAENCSPICRVSIQFKAGARNESVDNAGATHVLRVSAGLSTKDATQFAIIRNIQQVGASLSCMADRETVAYTLEGTRDAIEQVMPFLTEVATKQAFRPWELSDNLPRLKLELATRPPQQRAVDLLHKAAYRKGLGNSIYIAKHQLGKVNSETLQHYVATTFTSGRAAVIGLGVDHTTLAQYATSLQLPNGDGPNNATAYKGGEIRSDKGGENAFVAIGLPAAGFNNQKEAYAFAVLQRVLGYGPAVKRGCQSSSHLGKLSGSNHAISAFNVVYSDNGLFGLLIGASAKEAGGVVKAGVDSLKNINVSDADLARGKNQVTRSLLSNAESGSRAIHILGQQAVHKRAVQSFDELVSEINSLTVADVDAVAKKLSSKMSIAAVGNLSTVPFLDELK